MKFFIALAVILVQVSAAFAGQTRPAAIIKSHIETKKESHSQVSSSSSDKGLYAENVQSQHHAFPYRKIRDQRNWFNAATIQQADHIIFPGKLTTAHVQQAPAGIPISRLLLFPKHYFW